MEKKDYYTLKEIILGLRGEYLNHQQKLYNLKQFCDIDKGKAVDFNFRIHQSEQKNPTLLCEYIPKQNKIEKLITNFSKKSGFYIYGQHTAHLVTDNNQYYFLCGYTKYPVHVKYNYGMEEKFSSSVNSILKDEFSNSMRSQYIEDNCSDINAALTIDSTLINLYVRDTCSKVPYSFVLYDSSKDILEFKSFDEQFDKQSMETALDIMFPSEKLNKYHVRTIINSNESEKPMVLENFSPCDMAKFDIQDEGKQYVLRRIR